MNWFSLVLTTSAVLLPIVLYPGARQNAASKTPLPPHAQPAANSKSAKATTAKDNFHWSPLGLLETPLGVCGLVQRFGNKFAIRRGHLDDDEMALFPNETNAKAAVFAYCVNWYSQQKSLIRANSVLTGRLSAASTQKLYLNLRQPLFTKPAAMACPTKEALLYATAAHDHGWKYPGGLAGVNDPLQNSANGLPSIDSPVSINTWSCKVYAAGVVVSIKPDETTQGGAGDALDTNLGWMIPLYSLQN